MGSHIWIMRQLVRADDGTAVGTMKVFKTFVPAVGMRLAGYGIYRTEDADHDAEEIVGVTSVHTPTESNPDYFTVELGQDDAEGPIRQAISIYGTGWNWTFYPAETPG